VSGFDPPKVTPIGNLNDLLGQVGQVPGREPSSSSYQKGDYVWATNNPDGSGTRWLAHIESAHSVRSFIGRRWLVRVRRTKFWTSGAMHMYVIAALTAEEFAHNRKFGLIPAAGEHL